MSEYYAVQRSTDHLAHYGVKGMKWGVRKAIEKGNIKKLDKHYSKALKKIKKLNNKADIRRQQNEVKGHLHNAGADVVSGGIIGGLGMAARHLGGIKGISGLEVGGAGLVGAGAYHLARAAAAKHRTTAKGHTKAVQKRDNFKKEMQNTFKGTKYSNLPGSNKKAKSYQYDSFKTQMKDSAKAAALSTVVHPSAATMIVQNKKIANEIPANNNRHRKIKKRR